MNNNNKDLMYYVLQKEDMPKRRSEMKSTIHFTHDRMEFWP